MPRRTTEVIRNKEFYIGFFCWLGSLRNRGTMVLNVKKKYVFIIAIALVFTFCASFYAFLAIPQVGFNRESIEDVPSWVKLPGTAKNISYYHRPTFFTAFEYEVSEKDFLNWAQKSDQPLSPLSQRTIIARYSGFLKSLSEEEKSALKDNETMREAVISKGYEYLEKFSNGGRLHIVYDSENQKAYYQFSHR